MGEQQLTGETQRSPVSPPPVRRTSRHSSLEREGSAKPRRFAELLPSSSQSSSGLNDTLKRISNPSLGSWPQKQADRSRSRSRSDNENDDEVESQHGEDFGDLSRARSFWKNLDSETVRKTSIDSSTLSRRQSQDVLRSASTVAVAVSKSQDVLRSASTVAAVVSKSQDVLRSASTVAAAVSKSSLQQPPTRPERKNSGLSAAAADVSRRSSSSTAGQPVTGSWRPGSVVTAPSRLEPLPDYEEETSSGDLFRSKSLVTSRRDEERRSRSLEKKFSTVGGVASSHRDSTGEMSTFITRRRLSSEHKQDGVGRKMRGGGEGGGGSSSLPRGVGSLRRVSVLSDAPSYEDRSKSPDYNRGRRDSLSADRSRRNSREVGGEDRRGSTAMDVDYDRGRRDYPIVKRGSLGGGGGHPEDFGPRDVAAVSRRGSGATAGESKHFLSLQIFSKVCILCIGSCLTLLI